MCLSDLSIVLCPRFRYNYSSSYCTPFAVLATGGSDATLQCMPIRLQYFMRALASDIRIEIIQPCEYALKDMRVIPVKLLDESALLVCMRIRYGVYDASKRLDSNT